MRTRIEIIKEEMENKIAPNDIVYIEKKGVATCCRFCGLAFSHTHKKGTKPRQAITTAPKNMDNEGECEHEKELSYQEGKEDAEFELKRLQEMTVFNEGRHKALEEVTQRIAKITTDYKNEPNTFINGMEAMRSDVLSLISN